MVESSEANETSQTCLTMVAKIYRPIPQEQKEESTCLLLTTHDELVSDCGSSIHYNHKRGSTVNFAQFRCHIKSKRDWLPYFVLRLEKM